MEHAEVVLKSGHRLETPLTTGWRQDAELDSQTARQWIVELTRKWHDDVPFTDDEVATVHVAR